MTIPNKDNIVPILPKDTSLGIDVFDAYFALMEPSSECPTLYHRWSLISTVSSLLGRQAYLPFGIDDIYPNMYICLLGNAGTRKSSAVKAARKLLEGTGYTKFARERTSKEKFLKDLSVGFDVVNGSAGEDDDVLEMSMFDMDDDSAPKSTVTAEVYISAGELEDFMGQGDAPFISLLTNLWDNLPRYGHGKMTSKDIYIHEPTINILGGCTPTTFNSVFPPEVIGQGMLSRLILVYGDGAKNRITLPPPLDKELQESMVELLVSIKETIVGEFTVTPEAFKIWDEIYHTDINLGDSRFENYLNRRHIHYYKLCLVVAAMDLSMTITAEHAIKANTILHYTERFMPKALGEFGKAKNADVSNIVYNAICAHYASKGKSITPMELFTEVGTNFESLSKDFTQCLTKLKQSKKVIVAEGGLVPVALKLNKAIPHTNLDLLIEYKEYKRKNPSIDKH